MIRTLPLAFRYVAYYRVRTLILVICVSLALFLPLTVHVLVGQYHRIMIQRAEQTPLVIGARGSVYDLTLAALYFRGSLDRRITMEEVHLIRDGGLATPAPMHLRYTAGGYPIVGTTLDYFDFRSLEMRQGRPPQLLGDVVLGASVARRLNLSVGDKLLSDDEQLYDLSSTYPLLMRVVGVLRETGTADDGIILADIRTTWVIEGIGHGHEAAQNVTDPTMIRGFSRNNVVMSAALPRYNEITAQDLDSFHFHGDPAEFPVSAIIALPRDRKSQTILKNRYPESGDVQVIVPSVVVDEIMDVVLRVKKLFDAVFTTVLASTVLFLLLVMLLSARIRRREFQTLTRIGCSRSTVLAMQAGELGLILSAAVVIAAAMLAGVMWCVVRFDVLL